MYLYLKFCLNNKHDIIFFTALAALIPSFTLIGYFLAGTIMNRIQIQENKYNYICDTRLENFEHN